VRKGGWGRSALALLLGTVIGTLAGQILGAFLAPGPWREMFLKGASVGLRDPLRLDLAVFQVAFGLTLSVNPFTIVGFLLALLLVFRFSR
jgi:hypothetical protein